PAAPAPSAPAPATPATPAALAYADVKPVLSARCASCHAGTFFPAAAAAYPLTLSNDDADFAETVARTNPQTPDASLLLTKALGQAHGGGAVLTAGSTEHTTLVQWIQGGAAR
ncbi:MAG: hypothetical protein JKY65_11250, partial [Planctomycetes bacterium]|nr:hypothetical protein [Planctomycetota bacterium]